MPPRVSEDEVEIRAGGASLGAVLAAPYDARGIVVFAHGTGSSRFSPRNRFVADSLQNAGMATLLMDLLTREEEDAERLTRHLRFDIDLLVERLAAAIDWLKRTERTKELALGLFGASTGAAAALAVAAARPNDVRAVVSRGGRPDLAGAALKDVRAPTLLLVGANDREVLELNRTAAAVLGDLARIEVVPRASHLFEEPGALEHVARSAADWFQTTFGRRPPRTPPPT